MKNVDQWPPKNFRMHPQMTLGPVSLTVNDLDQVLAFYVEDMELKMFERSKSSDGEVVELGAGEDAAEPLLRLRHDPNARQPPRKAAGLYHYAILLPDRKSLASAYLSLGKKAVAFDGFADHSVSESLYLTDPEGNGIEIYADRPREKWKFDGRGRVQMGTDPLNINSLLKELSEKSPDLWKAIPSRARIGHVHLKVTDIKRSVDFYRNILGLGVTSDWGSAAFLSAGGYHHHIGMNTWLSLGGSSLAESWTGLEFFTITVPYKSVVHERSSKLNEDSPLHSKDSDRFIISDPDGIRLLVRTLKIE